MNIRRVIRKYEKKILKEVAKGQAEALVQNVEIAKKHFSRVKAYEKFIKILKEIR